MAIGIERRARWLYDLRRIVVLALALWRGLAVPLVRRRLGLDDDRTAARRLCRTLEALGVTYLKLGQYLATRHDLLPPVITDELEKFFEDVPPLGESTVRRILEEELGAPVEKSFAELRFRPIAAASIAQVHEALTHRGERVAVKIRRPGIVQLFASDVRIWRTVGLALDRTGISGTLSLVEAIDQFESYTRREMDFRIEGQTADRLRGQVTENAVVPRIDWALSTSACLTMELLDGPSLAEVRRLRQAGEHRALQALLPEFDLKQILHNLTRACLRQLFVTGFFHGDPHPGNILVLPDNRVAFIDFGIFGELNRHQRELLARYTATLAAGDIRACYRHISQIYIPGPESDEDLFREDVLQTLGDWLHNAQRPDAAARDRHLGQAFDGMVIVVRRHRYTTTMNYLLFWRAIIVLDSVALRLDPDFDLTAEARRFFLREAPDVLLNRDDLRSFFRHLSRLAVDPADGAASSSAASSSTASSGTAGGRLEVETTRAGHIGSALVAVGALAWGLAKVSTSRIGAPPWLLVEALLSILLIVLVMTPAAAGFLSQRRRR